MNNTIYKNQIRSPFQMAQRKPFERKDPLKEEIEKNTGSFNLSITIEEDIITKTLFSHIQGFIGFIATIKKDNVVLGIGRGSTILNKMNKYVERNIRFAFGSSIIDGINRSIKTMDDLFIKTSNQENPGILNEETNEIDYTPELASEKQKSYLKQLISINVLDERERSQWESELDELTKDEASQKIQFFLK